MTNTEANILIGKTAKDKITGFQGIITGYVQYLNGESQAQIAPPIKNDGTYIEPIWFDTGRIEVDENTPKIVL